MWQCGMPPHDALNARSMKASYFGKLKRRLIDLVRRAICSTNDMLAVAPYEMQHLWDKCRRIGAQIAHSSESNLWWQSRTVPDQDQLQLLIKAITAAVHEQQSGARRERTRVWKEHFSVSWDKGGSSVFQW